MKSELGGSVSKSCLRRNSRRLFFVPENSAAVRTLCPTCVAASNIGWVWLLQFSSLRVWCSRMVVGTFSTRVFRFCIPASMCSSFTLNPAR